ncbi:MAG: thioredoxin domain-containing protein [Myxococcota bacterium]
MTLGPGRTIVGRESGDILLRDPEASALHAEIEFTKGHVIVRDLGSRNGTLREGKRLPQFALYQGQSFRCGTTDITLVEILGADAPLSGGTASGSESEPDPRSSSTLPSTAIASDDGDAPTSHASSSGTAPQGSAGGGTLVGPAPAPGGPIPVRTPAALAPTAPGFDTSAPAPEAPVAAAPEPASEPVAAPAPGAPVAEAPVAASAPIPAGVPSPVVATHSAPVANAVIKLGDAQPRSAKRRAPVEPGARRRLVIRVVLGLVAAGLLGGLIYGIVSLITGRSQAFMQQLARELPEDTVGMLAVSSPRSSLELFGDEVPEPIRTELEEELGMDPFDPESYTSWGFDIDEPMGVALLDGDGGVAVSVGLKDKDAMRKAISSKAAELLGAEDDLRWIERSYAETPGLWLDEPIAVAALLSDKRVIFVTGGSSEEVESNAKRVAQTKKGESLADRPGFGEIKREKGKILVGMYVDGQSGRAALPGKGMELMAARMALADLDGMAVMLSDDGPRLHLSFQTILREDVKAVEMFAKLERGTDLIDRLPKPVLAVVDGIFDPKQLEGGFGLSGPLALTGFENDFREETGLDIRTDLIDNLDGQYGFALHNLPPEDGELEDFGAIMWAGLRDGEAARKTAERFYGRMEGELDLELDQVAGTTIYVVDDKPKLQYFIHEGVLWGAIGKVDLAAFIKGTGESFRKDPRIDVIKKATKKGGLVSGMLDIRELLAEVRSQLDEDDKEDMDKWKPVYSMLEVLTLRGEQSGRTFVFRTTLHTSSEHALADLTRGLMKVIGEEVAEDLARNRRYKRCNELIDHVVDLMKTELAAVGFEDDMFERRHELMDECLGDDTTDTEIDCILAATTLKAVNECSQDAKSGDEGGDGTPVKVLDEPEPSPVPYVDDIWPNTTPAGTAKGRPESNVNYAVPLGSEPPVRGPDNALVTVVMFGDFQCPYCKRVLPTLDALLAKNPEVRLVFRHNPLPMHDQAEMAARAAVAAGRQDKFWEMHDKLFDNNSRLSESQVRLLADEIGLDLVRFDRDFSDAETAAVVQRDLRDAKKFGVVGTPAFFVNGRHLAGAQPIQGFETVVDEEQSRAVRYVERRGNTRKDLYEGMTAHFASEVIAETTTPVTTTASETRHTIDTTGLPRKGATGFVRVEIVECGDFDCPFCKRATPTLDRVLTDYEGKVAMYWLHNPLSFHVGAEPAARAAVAAHAQGKFWEMHDKLFEDKSKRDKGDFIGYAAELGLDTVKFKADFDASSTANEVTTQQKLCTDNEARGTPTFFINGRLMSGAQSYDKLKDIIEQELASGI